MKVTFNLIDDPWIIVRTLAGQTETVSVRELFYRAHEFKGLAGELPSQDFAVLRNPLLAILYRALDAEESEEPEELWASWWNAEKLPIQEIDNYLDKWHHRFELFDDVQPFMQVPDLHTAKGEVKPVDLLVPDSPNTTLFAPRRTYESLTPAEAVRWLIHCQAYDVSGIKTGAVGDDRVKGGKGYAIGVGFAGWLGGITVMGQNLRETLLLNLVTDREHSPKDLPIWEEPPLTSAVRSGARAYGQVGLFTWPQRRVRLFTGEDGCVTNVLITNGDAVDYKHQNQNETMTCWRYSKPQSSKTEIIYMPKGFEHDQSVWRGLSALLPITGVVESGPEPYLPCKVLEWSAMLANYGYLPDDKLTEIQTVGVKYGPNMASWDEVFSDTLAFNVQLAATTSSYAKEAVLSAVERASQAVRALVRLADNLAKAAGDSSSDSSTDAQVKGWSSLDGPFRNWLMKFDPQSNVDGQLQQWTDNTRTVINEIAADLIRNAGPTAWVGRVVETLNQSQVINTGQASVWFRAALAKALPYSVEEKEETDE